MSLVAVITGDSSGIGAATARRLAREPGAQLVLVARREERLRELEAELRATYVAADVTDADAPARIAAHVQERHGRLTLQVNNAGASWQATFADGGYPNVRQTMEVNFESVVRLTEALLPLLRASMPSAIVTSPTTRRMRHSLSPAWTCDRNRARGCRSVRRSCDELSADGVLFVVGELVGEESFNGEHPDASLGVEVLFGGAVLL